MYCGASCRQRAYEKRKGTEFDEQDALAIGAFADYARFIADHHARVRRLALATDSALAPVVAEFHG